MKRVLLAVAAAAALGMAGCGEDAAKKAADTKADATKAAADVKAAADKAAADAKAAAEKAAAATKAAADKAAADAAAAVKAAADKAAAVALLLPLLLRQRLLLHLPPHLLLRHRLRSLNCYTLRGRRVLPDSRLVCSLA